MGVARRINQRQRLRPVVFHEIKAIYPVGNEIRLPRFNIIIIQIRNVVKLQAVYDIPAVFAYDTVFLIAEDFIEIHEAAVVRNIDFFRRNIGHVLSRRQIKPILPRKDARPVRLGKPVALLRPFRTDQRSVRRHFAADFLRQPRIHRLKRQNKMQNEYYRGSNQYRTDKFSNLLHRRGYTSIYALLQVK